jgi:hypothetical protein
MSVQVKAAWIGAGAVLAAGVVTGGIQLIGYFNSTTAAPRDTQSTAAGHNIKVDSLQNSSIDIHINEPKKAGATLSNNGSAVLIAAKPEISAVTQPENQVAIVSPGTRVTVLEEQPDAKVAVMVWKKVRILAGPHEGKEGWVSASAVQVDD